MIATGQHPTAVVIGGGPAGLMAAEALSAGGVEVDVFDAMPSLGRKFLLAGIGGLNITHSEPFAQFCSRYDDRQPVLQNLLDEFGPDALRAWVHGLGVETFVGTSGRVFPTEMKAAPLLRAWLRRLRGAGVRTHVRSRWLGWDGDGRLRLSTPQGELSIQPSVTVLALGGASWPQLGSDGAWVPLLQGQGVSVAPLESANCGFQCQWSDYILDKFAGAPLKNIALMLDTPQGERLYREGECVISSHGVEGSLIYALSRPIRALLHSQGQAQVAIDLLPAFSAERVRLELAKPRATLTWTQVLKKRLGLSGLKLALLHELSDPAQVAEAAGLAQAIKCLPLLLSASRPIQEAISSAGGVCFDSVTPQLMLRNQPATFVAGEMLDWEAPTGGYLLTACLASGLAAGRGALAYLRQTNDPRVR